ncbi:McrB family protein, partial [Vreelandella alkaliphila]|uniref:McrB family protein n=1 Tax=Vreelandella alkaliphila TaxID=272774 RepID=UPI003FD75B8A
MQLYDAIKKSKIWIEQLVGKELQYITGRNVAVIESIDWDEGGKICVTRGEAKINIRFERIEAVVAKLIKGHPIHVDTFLRSGSNDRSAIETIIANFPPVGFMLRNQGRNKSNNKVIQWLNKEIHPIGMIKNISEGEFSGLTIKNFSIIYSEKLPKPFLLLAGISGTGKTRFVREQAKTTGQFNETYCLTSVRPDWHEPSDLLGYISRLSSSGQAEYITTDVLQFIAKAWRAIADSNLTIDVQNSDDHGERLVVGGDRGALQAVLPYWLCLDEMNLAPVEQYFADYLSVLETREWDWDEDTFIYSSDALLKPATINAVADTDKLRVDLGFELPDYDDLWQLICQYGLAIPFNLMVAGTVNMDETTHGFSRKVIDRALSFDFGEFFPNDYDAFFAPTSHNKSLGYPIWSQARKDDLANTCDADESQTLAFLSAVNKVLKTTPFELAYRALNELLLAVVSTQPQDELTLKAVWD